MHNLRTAGLALILAGVLAGSAAAYNSIGANWRAAYPTACQDLVDASNDCSLCHGGGFSRNDYAQDYNGSWASIENMDSDGDGRTNLQEINECTLPGNASSHVGNEVDTWSTVKSLYR